MLKRMQTSKVQIQAHTGLVSFISGDFVDSGHVHIL